MKQYLVYQDDLGYVTVEVVGNISFLNGNVFLTIAGSDGNERDITLGVEQIVDIGLTDCVDAI